ncbi:AraC family transcriptional regulator [Sulfurovum sp. ST-21]|uniref:AraC family transcriptional regulator n=1 Tax=Sulfurovum indicum TaxID=2779528 RepID=A0A7M1S3H2_9BACT|nr:AraC family transcriptional regulator [Sulfurovum indicum]QOR61279.1 AraC family transcriptional regulator [Sulfurovum indicum]
MKKETYWKNVRIANDLMFYIYTHIDTQINLDEIAKNFHIDKYYLHKIFKSIFGRNIYESIKSIRLQKASNLLLTNRHSTISQIANACGYSSQTSFIRAFKARFGMTPKAWRNGGYLNYSDALLSLPNDQNAPDTLSVSEPTIIKRDPMEGYYLRDNGYGEHIKYSWQKLQTLIYTLDLKEYKLISLFHDNPAITQLASCQHVSAISFNDDGLTVNLPKFKIAGGVYACFNVSGKREDLLKFIRWVYHTWLPKSGYETTTKPPYAIYCKNHHLDRYGRFEMDFYLSITL